MAPADPKLTSKPHEDESDIGSGANTPPGGGTSTPRPDLSDKRLPQLSNFFAQVRVHSSFSLLPFVNSTTVAPSSGSEPASEMSGPTHQSGTLASIQKPGIWSAFSTPKNSSLDSSQSSLDSSDPSMIQVSKRSSQLQEQGQYPTPPLSSSSSTTKLAEAGQNARRVSVHATKGTQSNGTCRTPPPPSRLRSNTLTSTTTTTGITQAPVTAEISNPATEDPTSPTHPSTSSFLSSSRRSSGHSSGSSNKRKRGLTNGKTEQNTPPQTPRALSNESRTEQANGGLRGVHKTSRSSSANSAQAPVNQIKGQLQVSIVEGRGLRPSTAPYVVCIFQLNEDISDGAQQDAMDTRQDHAQEEDLAKGVAMRRLGSDQGRPLSIPGLRSRQSSQTNIAQMKANASRDERVTAPTWKHEATFDVVGEQSELDISIYDKSNNEAFLGQVRFTPSLEAFETAHEGWYKLRSREGEADQITGEIRLRLRYKHTDKKVYGPEDFEILKLIGKGTFGQVFQVRKKDNRRIYAMKVLSKKVIIQKKEVQHTIGERNILVRTATTNSPFIVGLKFSFQTSSDLYLVTDYMSGGELFWHLQREGRFLEDRAKFYIAELILALRHLHQHDIVYRDLKPENILLDANGHIALCDFGLSKANLSKGDTTNTFCGTTEYLAPEVLLDEQGYTKMVDFWSLGVLVFEMCCGWSPFYAEDTQQMYKNIAFGKVRFPRDALSVEGRNFVKGLLNRNPNHRLGAKGDADELMAHAFFADVDWAALGRKALVPPFKPKLKGELDTSNFDPEFTNALNAGNASSLNARAAALAAGINPETPLSPTLQTAFKGFTFVDESNLDRQFGNTLSRVSTREEENDLRRTISKDDRMTGVDSNEPEGMFADDMMDD
ncbi:serine/threonine-protein kinase-19 [Elsinoe australis]|uniref:non-specific serine/threonine protein kinase n=1 Tax=Elsinoe australis TaxID=40998 RepID=A0A4U7AYS8_9PEZI|nr:serine/threonine-protein kinase-19 [Elsinoe australis]